MAETQALALLGGYEDEFVDSVDEDLHCSICHLPLKEAVQTGKCGHRFCRQCLDEHFRRLELNQEPLYCPVERNTLIRDKDIFPDKATQRKILSFNIKCPSDGCQWTGELRSKTDHLASCPLKIVSCANENCYEAMTRNNLQKHATTKCPWRILRCSHCNASHPDCKTEAHLADCKKFPLNCPQNCGAVILREEMSTHIAEDCPLSSISCPYGHMGCNAEIKRRDVETHLQTAMRPHLDLACVKLSDTQDQLNQTQEQLRNLQKKFEDTTRELEKKFNDLEKKIQYSGENCDSFKWRIDSFSDVLRKAKRGVMTFVDSSPF